MENNDGNGPSSDNQHKAREDPIDYSEFTPEDKSQPATESAAKEHLHTHPIHTIDENTTSSSSPDRPTSRGGKGGNQDGAADYSPDPTTPTQSPSTQNKRYYRRSSATSNLSLDSMREGRGIKIGAAKPTTGSSSDEGRRFSRLDGQ